MEQERRYVVTPVSLEMRADDGAAPQLKGLIPYDSLSLDLGGFREVLKPGAFSETIKNDDIVGLFNHESSLILGRSEAGTLSFQDTDKGLGYTLDLPDTQAGRDLQVSVKRGDIKGTSFSFWIKDMADEQWVRDGDSTIRNILRATLGDVSPVTFPAYPESQVDMRSFKEWERQLYRQLHLRQRRQRLTEHTT